MSLAQINQVLKVRTQITEAVSQGVTLTCLLINTTDKYYTYY